jgi:hypothetical protein
MEQGKSIKLKHGATDEAIFDAALKSKAEKMRSAKGWFGVVTINVEASGEDKGDGETCLVKVRAGGLDLFRVSSHMSLETTVKKGKVKKA